MIDLNRSKMSQKNKEETTDGRKTMKIEGMMCGHCEAAVKKALEALRAGIDTGR